MTITVTFLRHRTARKPRASAPVPFAGKVRRRLTNHTGLQLPSPFQRRYRKPIGGPFVPFAGKRRHGRNPSIAGVLIWRRKLRLPKSQAPVFRQPIHRRKVLEPYRPALPLRHRTARRPIAAQIPPALPKRRRRPIAATTKATAFRKRRKRAPLPPPFMGRVRRRQPAQFRAIPPKAAPPTLGHRKAKRPLASLPPPSKGRRIRRRVPGTGLASCPVQPSRVSRLSKACPPAMGKRKRRRVPGSGQKAAFVVQRHRTFRAKQPSVWALRGTRRRSRWVMLSNSGYLVVGPYSVSAQEIYFAGAVAGTIGVGTVDFEFAFISALPSDSGQITFNLVGRVPGNTFGLRVSPTALNNLALPVLTTLYPAGGNGYVYKLADPTAFVSFSFTGVTTDTSPADYRLACVLIGSNGLVNGVFTVGDVLVFAVGPSQ